MQKPATSEMLVSFFRNHPDFEGHFYIGYPSIYTNGANVAFDGLWISKKYGIVIFDIVEGNQSLIQQELVQDKLYAALDGKLREYHELRKGRNFNVNIEVITFAPTCTRLNENANKIAFNEADLLDFVSALTEWTHYDLYDNVLSIIQSVTRLKVKSKRDNVKKNDSRGHKLKDLENTLATLDNDQERAVVDYYEGLQRIRGLAGSGKTVVIALKAVTLHLQNPDWNIAVTFNTRSLKQQFKDLISRICADKTKGELLPDWDKIKVINAWGKPRDTDNEKGLYYETCIEHGIEYFDFRRAEAYAVSKGWKKEQAFEAVCHKATNEIKNFKPKYDAILVDEAQDLSEAFLNLCHLILKEPKRLIYAYDELQKLNEGVSLRNPTDILQKNIQFDDKILSKCYRNSRPILVTAHALGFGIYRKDEKNKLSLVQFFDQPQLWQEVGYTIKEGELKVGSNVTLCRQENSSPKYLENVSENIDDLITFKSFTTKEHQAQWIAGEIKKNLQEDELLVKDIIVINPIGLTTKREVALVRDLLFRQEIKSHIAGEFDADIFFESNSIAFTGINRAKGNEVPMVYIINADDCYADDYFTNQDLIKRRNILFTAITRSKAWVRVCGVGVRMEKLIEEFNEVKRRDFELQFRYPTEEEIKKMNVIHRDVSQEEKQKINQDVSVLKNMVEIIRRIKSKESLIEDYPKEVQDILYSLKLEEAA